MLTGWIFFTIAGLDPFSMPPAPSPAARRGGRGREVPAVPLDAAIDRIDHVAGLAQAVAFARVADHDGFDAGVAEGDEVLLGFGDRHVVVVLAVHEHDRRLHLRDVAERRSLPEEIHQALLVRERPEFDGEIVDRKSTRLNS